MPPLNRTKGSPELSLPGCLAVAFALMTFSSVTVAQVHFVFNSTTGNSANVAVPLVANPNAGGVPLSAGDEIGVFDGSLCVGATVWDSTHNVAIAVWGDNVQTTPIDGMIAGNLMSFRVWIKSTNTEFTNVSVSYSLGNGIYSANGVYILASLNVSTATKFVITGSGTQTTGASQNLTITATDVSGNTDLNYGGDRNLTFSGASTSTNPVMLPTVKDKAGVAVAFGTPTTITFVAGVSTVSGGINGAMVLYRAESATIIATAGTLTTSGADRLTVVVSASGMNKFVLNLNSPQTNGVAFTGTSLLTAQDAYGNTVSYDASLNNVTIAAVAPLTGAVSGLSGANKLVSASDFVAGVADLTALGMRYAGNAATGTFAASSTTGGYVGTSGNVTINAGALSNFLVESSSGGAIGAQTAGTPFTIKVTARDANNNMVTGFTGTVNITSTGTLSLGGEATAAFIDGVLASHTVAISNTGNFTITATKPTTFETGTSNTFTLNPGVLADFLVGSSAGGAIGSQTAGTPFTIKVTARDANNNTVTGFTGTVNITSTGTLSLGSGATAAFVSGVLASHSVAISNTGNFTITATKPTTLETGTSNAFELLPSSWSFIGGTGSNATIGIHSAISPSTGLRPLQTGDGVGAFFVRNDSLICAGYSLWQAGQDMVLSIFGDNSQTPLKDGFAEGELIRYKIWDSQMEKEYPANAQYQTGGSTYATNGIYQLSSLMGVRSISHRITLPQGWNLISSFVAPKDTTLDSMFVKVNPRLVLVKNNAGLVYWPSFGINTIGKWNRSQGYQVYMQSADTLSVTGDEIDPQLTPIVVPQGWNMVSYLRNSHMRTDSAVTTIAGNIVLVKNNYGQVYWPAFGINQIGNMKPGQGYQLYLASSGTLTYPANVSPAPPSTLTKIGTVAASQQEMIPQHFIVRTGLTGNSATIVIQGSGVSDGDEVGVTVGGGMLVGSGVVSQGKVVVAVWGDDLLTEGTKEGAVEGETLKLKLWQNRTQTEKGLEIETVADGLTRKILEGALKYKTDGVWVVGVKETQVIPTVFSLEQNYPNPFNPSTVIRYGLPRDVKVKLTVYNVLGQQVMNLVDEEQKAGYHEILLQGSSLSSGVYFYGLVTGEFRQTKKLLLLK